jgi:hypothetical protein
MTAVTEERLSIIGKQKIAPAAHLAVVKSVLRDCEWRQI